MKIIELTKGFVTVVDDEDFEVLNKHSWQAKPDWRGIFYVSRQFGKRATRNWVRYYVWRKRVYMHREIMKARSGEHVDHKDHFTFDNRKANLRISTPTQNKQNQRRQTNNTSGFKGVDSKNGTWRARIACEKLRRHLGYFDTAEDAARAYDTAAKQYHGKFALLNFP